MKSKASLSVVLIFLTGCSLIWKPTAAVKSFLAAAQKGDVDTMTKLFSSKAIQKTGLDKIRSNNRSFADMVQSAAAAGGNYRMVDVQETSMPFDGQRVSFFYKNDSGTEPTKLVFDLSQEGLAWKIDHIGGAEMDQTTILVAPPPIAPAPEPSPLTSPSEKVETETKSGTKSKAVSGGVLNGRAISLPKPPYPPIAKAAKASGTVVVQVTIDEEGRVISARAVSGHPLLQAAAVAAARSAKFVPTKLGGELVKVTGVITYDFSPQ